MKQHRKKLLLKFCIPIKSINATLEHCNNIYFVLCFYFHLSLFFDFVLLIASWSVALKWSVLHQNQIVIWMIEHTMWAIFINSLISCLALIWRNLASAKKKFTDCVWQFLIFQVLQLRQNAVSSFEIESLMKTANWIINLPNGIQSSFVT